MWGDLPQSVCCRNRFCLSPKPEHSSPLATSEHWRLQGASFEGCKTHLLDEVHEAATKAPGLVPMALQGVHGHLRRSLVAHRHNVDRIVEQGCIGLQRAQACLRAAASAPLPQQAHETPGRKQALRLRESTIISPEDRAASADTCYGYPSTTLFSAVTILSPDPLPDSSPNPTHFLFLSCLSSLISQSKSIVFSSFFWKTFLSAHASIRGSPWWVGGLLSPGGSVLIYGGPSY